MSSSSKPSVPLSYSASEQAYYEVVAREVQERASVSNLLDLTQFAFKSCVHSFVHHELTTREQKCLTAASKKYIAVSIRATSRLAESQAAAAAATRAEAELAYAAALVGGGPAR
jgi:hypothetical protein